ncbi:MAG: hypothetical protein A2887_02915 [Alphaproteobacteria bacterium RIFCSPLOWO2_01_FULL_40_26]|nr:MAG: hypothetical protein A3D15_02620 [Alphaproteobacteria bacterium RIFCSPHIGHO2_02_FULL_40_34]OFW86352.1 MAG: hypothetical protein A2794_03235 [Alphaproteobacteria bacterium RIFCSPHIGHO2_01_FULL_40_8]OFW95114.1 MAG: hypothetical protein A2887_02915 [Alphaproteobacteria bacterium RIFCSPLOWO2_01_FULL_40_26]OFX09063.1 MAG: hypothetical protein A3H30_03435 [Alphaproteobacteria bacterium RIFCSPLOWO2_02_FULL_40_19]OFX10716.1 MAG: hypothetical protein A3G22_03345 [Alphaproteobacteria bacterium RI
MQIMSYELLNQNLGSVIDQIARERDIIHVTRHGHESVVIISESDFDAMQTTIHLLSNSTNAARLSESFKQAKDGDFVDVEWDEDK